jgi:hypothetical protein
MLVLVLLMLQRAEQVCCVQLHSVLLLCTAAVASVADQSLHFTHSALAVVAEHVHTHCLLTSTAAMLTGYDEARAICATRAH